MNTYYTNNTPDEPRTSPHMIKLAEALFPLLPGSGWSWLPAHWEDRIGIVSPDGIQFFFETMWKKDKYRISQDPQQLRGTANGGNEYIPAQSAAYANKYNLIKYSLILPSISVSSKKTPARIAKDISSRLLPDAETTFAEEIRLIELEIIRRSEHQAIIDRLLVVLGGNRPSRRNANHVFGGKCTATVSGGLVKLDTEYLTPDAAEKVMALLNTL